jgi:probable poly-beta-1,6-N-acetyl-D-glucosamine export protein
MSLTRLTETCSVLQPTAADLRMNAKLTTLVAARAPSDRSIALDVLRGAGALSVIVLHASAGPLTEESALGHASWMLLVPNVTARFAVPVFMILSGMGLTLSARRDEDYPRFLWRRLSKILPAYVAWSLIYAWAFPNHESMSLRTLVADLITGQASHHLYFVPAIVRLYLLYPVASYLAQAVPFGVAGCCALSWSMIWLSPLLARMPFGALMDDVLPLRWMGYFVFGIWLARARLAERRTAVPRHSDAPTRALRRAQALAPLVAIASLGCMIAIVRSVTEQSADIDVALGAAEPLVFPYSIAILLWSTGLPFGDGRFVRFLRFVSDHSYAVYLCHVLMLQLCALGLEALAAESTHLTTFSICLALGIPLALATAVLSDRAKQGYRMR